MRTDIIAYYFGCCYPTRKPATWFVDREVCPEQGDCLGEFQLIGGGIIHSLGIKASRHPRLYKLFWRLPHIEWPSHWKLKIRAARIMLRDFTESEEYDHLANVLAAMPGVNLCRVTSRNLRRLIEGHSQLFMFSPQSIRIQSEAILSEFNRWRRG